MTKLGFKVAICEQTENIEALKERIKEAKKIKKDDPDAKIDEINACMREVAQIYTKGTHFDTAANNIDFETKYVLSFVFN